MNKYNPTMLQSKSVTNIIKVLLKLWDAFPFKGNAEFESIGNEIKSLKKQHHNALSHLKGFKDLAYWQQLKRLNSEAHLEQYKQSTR